MGKNINYSASNTKNENFHNFRLQVTDQKRQMYPPDSKSHRSEIEVTFAGKNQKTNPEFEFYYAFQKTIRDVREKHDKQLMQQLEEMEKNKK